MCLVLTITLASCKDAGVQDQEQFEIGVRNFSTSPSLVMIEVLRSPDDVATSHCVYGRNLIWALFKEHNLPPTDDGMRKAFEIADKAPRHRFAFSSDAAFATLGIADDRRDLAKACELIRSGRPAQLNDMTGFVAEGQPTRAEVKHMGPGV